MKINNVIGSGGGGKSGGESARAPVEAADSLRSKAYANILDLVSEGEIEGLVNGLRSIFLDGTPIQNKDLSYNFQGVSISTRNGSQNQEYIPGFSEVESEQVVGLEVKYDTPIVRTISDPNINAIRLGVSIPQLTYQDPNTGDLGGSEVRFAIDLQSNGGGYQEVLNDKISGKCVSKYERKYRIELKGSPPWDIRFRRITPDATSVTTQNRTIFDSYTSIIDAKLKYPNSALVGLKIDSSQFSSIPTRGYEIRGIRIKVPNNYDPVKKTYSGVWNGQFHIAWTSNPAWIFYDLVTSERYGLGNFIPAGLVDKWSIYQIGKYCDELVPDGKGGFEPRFTCNVYIQSREEAFKVLQDFASCFRGMIYWASGLITAVQDSPSDAAYIFTTSNIIDGSFTYSGSSSKTRHSVALVGWNDPDDQYKQKIEYVEDPESIARYGIVETQVLAFGCTSRGQAHRVGKWLLYTEKHQTETVTFTTGLNGSLCKPGQVIKVSDPTRSGTRMGGRLKSGTDKVLFLDQSYTLNPNNYYLSLILPSGKVETRKLLSILNNRVEVQTAFSEIPLSNAIFVLQSNELNSQLFKIISVSESDENTYLITALSHNDQKYDHVEKGLVLEARSITSLNIIPDSPMGLTLTETLYQVNSEVRVKLTISWNAVKGASSYFIQYTKDNQNAVSLPQTSSNDVEILNAEEGEYKVTVWALSPLGQRSQPANASKKVFGKSIPPGNISGFSLIPMAGSASLTWDRSTSLAVLLGGTVRLRWTPEIINPSWKNSIDIVPGLAGGTTSTMAPLVAGTYMAKFFSCVGISSPVESRITTTIPEAVALNVIASIDEGPNFNGNKIGMYVSESLEGLTLAPQLSIDEIEEIDAVVNFDFTGGVQSLGSYDFEETFDLENIYTSRLSAKILADGVDVADTIDQRAELIDTWLDLDSEFIDDVNAELWLQTTNDDPEILDPIWSEWKRFFVGEYTARAFRFQVRAKSDSESHNIVIRELKINIDVPDRIFSETFVTDDETLSVSYDSSFINHPSIGVTATNMESGDFYKIENETPAGFDITFFDSSNNVISRRFSVYAKGYGRKI